MEMRSGERRDQRAAIFFGALSASIAKKQKIIKKKNKPDIGGKNEIKGQYPLTWIFPPPQKSISDSDLWPVIITGVTIEQTTNSRGCRYQKKIYFSISPGGLESLGESAESGELI